VLKRDVMGGTVATKELKTGETVTVKLDVTGPSAT
jgi:hypothetical protein